MQIELEAAQLRLNREHDQFAWLGWHIAALQRAKRLPRLETMLSKSSGRKRNQTWQEQMAVMGQWASVMRRVVKGGKR